MNSALHFISAVLACLSVLRSVRAMDLHKHQRELKQHYEHLAYIADFPCLHPQPKVIPVSELFSESQTHGKAYFPDVTVLHRCDEYTGSCTSGHKCAGKVTELVLLPFKATYLIDTEEHKIGSWAMEYHELVNHTVCGCAVPIPKESSHSDMGHETRSCYDDRHNSDSNYGGPASSTGSSNGYGTSSGSTNDGSRRSVSSNPGSSSESSYLSNNGNSYTEPSNDNVDITRSNITTEDYWRSVFGGS